MTTKPRSHYVRRDRALKCAPNPLMLRSCPQKKIAFRTRKIAMNRVAVAAKVGKVLSAYKCRFCHLWHITSQVAA